MEKKWGAKLTGHQFDLADWREELKAPFDPFVEQVTHAGEQISILWSSQFSALQTANEVRQRARGIIRRLNGIIRLQRACQPVEFDASVELVDGKFLVHRFLEIKAATIRIHGSPVTVRIVRNGVVQPPPQPKKSRTQTLLEAAEDDDLVADMFSYLARATDWYDLYKVIELWEKKQGGEHALAKLLGDKSESWKTAKASANFFRHARAYRPANLMTFEESKALVISIIRQIL